MMSDWHIWLFAALVIVGLLGLASAWWVWLAFRDQDRPF